MKTFLENYPSDKYLHFILTDIMKRNNHDIQGIKVLDRKHNDYTSTYPSEIITCLINDQTTQKIFCKYRAGFNEPAVSHRSDLEYEAKVYEEILMEKYSNVPKFYGIYKEDTFFMIAIEYIDEGWRLNKSLYKEAIYEASEWLGSFHKENEVRAGDSIYSFLKIYDYDYYLQWAEMSMKYINESGIKNDYPWLLIIFDKYREIISKILDIPSTIIHGECYPRNIIVANEKLFLLDWQSAAIGFGQIDLASLIEGWHDEVVNICEEKYKQSRWPEGAPDDFEEMFLWAQMYWHFRWLGNRSKWNMKEKGDWRFRLFFSAGEKLGLV